MEKKLINGAEGSVDIGGAILDIDAFDGSLSTPTKEFKTLGKGGTEHKYLGYTDGSGTLSGARDINDPAQNAIYANVVDTNDGTPEAPGVDSEATYNTVQLKLKEADGSIWVCDAVIEDLKFGAKKGEFQGFSGAWKSSGGIKLYTGVAV